MTEDEKFDHIIKRYRPKGWRVSFSRKSNEIALEAARRQDEDPAMMDCAFADPNKRLIKSPYVIDTFTLHILLHEYGHVHMKHWTSGDAHIHRQEFEAERWAAEIMRIEGIPVSRSIKRGIRRYIKFCIERDERNGIEIQPHVRRFAEGRKKK